MWRRGSLSVVLGITLVVLCITLVVWSVAILVGFPDVTFGERFMGGCAFIVGCFFMYEILFSD
ncbi:MAG: hypothetical protein YFSK_6410 [Candidatus Yanofskyibacterium parasiticum]|nr:MAG: hypothetical protein YFSK_6410 [Candidatus Yanofskybacteria bacterium]